MEIKEVWKDIPEYAGYYQISNMGRVKSISHTVKANVSGGIRETSGCIKKAFVGWHGYVWVSLCKDGHSKTFSMHRLVAIAFIDNPRNLPTVNHKDGNKENNCVENLEWCTNHENQMHAARNGLLPKSKKVLCVDTETIYQSSGEAERATGICGRNIRSACTGRYKTAGGYKWEWA